MKHFFRTILVGLLLISMSSYAQTQLACGVNDKHLPDSTVRLMGQLPRLMANQRARLAAGERNVCRVAIEIDSDTYLEFDKDTNRIKSFFLERIELTSKIFEREINTQLVVVYFHIWKDTEPDPYRGEQDLYKLHTAFSTAWASKFKDIPYDKRIYLPTKTTSGAGGLGGGIQATCANLAGIGTIAHELGHCFGSPHTHNCSWPGGPIDFCSTPDGGDCFKGSLEDIFGTIMSYCRGLFTSDPRLLTFHPLCQALITDNAIKTLPKLALPDKAPILPAQTSLAGSPFFYWNGQPMAEHYDIEVATTADFSQKVISDTTLVNGFPMSKLTVGQTYYVRVRATNKLGVSPWSAVSQLTRVAAMGTAAPVLLKPTPDQTQIPYNRGVRQFEVQPVDGATSYEVQLANPTDLFFKNPIFKITQPTASFTANAGQMGTVKWRARAMLGTQAGPWSAPGRYSVNPEPYYIGLPFYSTDIAPLAFPISYYQTSPDAVVKVTLATDSTFAKPISEQTLPTSIAYNNQLAMADKLSANTQYYIKIEESNLQHPELPTGLLTRVVQPFKTGNVALPERWSFINSSTRSDWPSGGTYDNLALADNAAWYRTTNGIARISQDSMTVRLYTSQNTKGKIGNLLGMTSADAERNIWFTNRTAVNVFKNGFAVPYFQVGKFSEQTGELVQPTTFYSNLYFTNFTASPRLYHAYNAVYEPKADTLAKIYALPENRSTRQTLVGTGVVWMIQNNFTSTTAPTELVQINTLTKAVQIFNADNTPQLGKYLNYMAIDGLGALWVSQSSTTVIAPFAKFSGQSWTTVERSAAMPISSVISMTSDPLGNLFVLENSTPRSLYKYDGVTWKKIADMPLYTNMGTMRADALGNVWFNGSMQVIRYAACANAPTPTLKVAKQTIEIGESTTLRAEGCTDVVWSWTSETETVTNRLVRGTNQLVVKPEANTTYRSRCYTVSCSGDETTLNVTVLPRLVLNRTTKTNYCQGDSLSIGYGLQGKVAANNQFSFVLKSGTQQTTFPATVRGTGLSMQLSASLMPGRYVVYLETTQPVVRTADSMQVMVSALPTADLSSNKLTFPLGDSARVSVALTGAAPWQFTRWDGQVIQAANSPYTTTLRATQPTNYSLNVTRLSDANCANGTIKNSLVISALALGNEPIAVGTVAVYPNPTTGRLVVEVTATTAPMTLLRLCDIQGRELLNKVPQNRSRREEWDISTLPMGQYVLQVETIDGGKTSWKVLKQ